MSQDTFNQIIFQFTTGGDNLRSNSELTADVFKNDQEAIAADAALHPQDSGTWDNNSLHEVLINVIETNVSDLKQINIVLRSHNDAFQSDDSWQVAHILVQLTSGGSPIEERWTEQDGNPFILSGHDGKSNVMIVTKDQLFHPL